jgi:hypothetical protein
VSSIIIDRVVQKPGRPLFEIRLDPGLSKKTRRNPDRLNAIPGKNQFSAMGDSAALKVASIFSQLLRLFPRTEFESVVRQHRGDRHQKGFTCWGQFIAMLFCRLGKAQSPAAYEVLLSA